jgi:putative membrane protein
MNKLLFCFGYLLILGFILCACECEDEASVSRARKQEFIAQASQVNAAQIELGTVALSRSTNIGVQENAKRAIATFTAASSDLQTIAEREKLWTTEIMDYEHWVIKQQLNAIRGYDFDTAYVHSQIRDLQSTIQLCDDHLRDGNTTGIKEYAASLRAAAGDHLRKADSLSSTLRR